MLFRLNIHLNEDDYLDFNIFHAFESAYGKGLIRKSRLSFVLTMVVLTAIVVCLRGWTSFSLIFASLSLIFTLLYVIFFKSGFTRSMKAHIKHLKKVGKLPFDPESLMEFYEDKLIETSPSSRTEQGYDTIERICIVKDRFILLYKSSVGAYILPLEQVKAQVDPEAFVEFLSRKCALIEYD